MLHSHCFSLDCGLSFEFFKYFTHEPFKRKLYIFPRFLGTRTAEEVGGFEVFLLYGSELWTRNTNSNFNSKN